MPERSDERDTVVGHLYRCHIPIEMFVYVRADDIDEAYSKAYEQVCRDNCIVLNATNFDFLPRNAFEIPDIVG